MCWFVRVWPGGDEGVDWVARESAEEEEEEERPNAPLRGGEGAADAFGMMKVKMTAVFRSI